MKKFATVLLCAAALAFAQIPQIPKRAPGFCLADTTGQWRDLADYRGKVVILEFMQTTCPHCIQFTGVLNGIAKKYGDKVQILSVALPPDKVDTMLQFTQSHPISWPLLFDMGQMTASYVRSPNLHFPAVYLIDGNAQLSREIDKLIAPASRPAAKK
jgi:peroxiredoxin